MLLLPQKHKILHHQDRIRRPKTFFLPINLDDHANSREKFLTWEFTETMPFETGILSRIRCQTYRKWEEQAINSPVL